MELTMNTQVNSRLATFNTLALHFQDEAYTLAYYLLGDENRATEVTQAAFSRLYQRSGLRLEQFRMEVLHWIWLQCRSSGISPLTRAVTNDDFFQQLRDLKGEERLAVVLVDVLGLNYEDAGRVMNCSKKQFSILLAQGRIKLGKMTHPAS